MQDQLYKYPRLYLNASFKANEKIALSAEQTHYLKNVLRRKQGDALRVFNGIDGEWFARIEAVGKKDGAVVLTEKLKEQPEPAKPVHLFFAPIKKQRLDLLLEKAVELGVQGLYPMITNRTENRKLNEGRMRAQIIEAAEQCERLDVPILHAPQKLTDVIAQKTYEQCEAPLFVCMERLSMTKPMSSYSYEGGAVLMTGPEGGFDKEEAALIQSIEGVKLINLGETILRAETAVTASLSYIRLSTAL